MYVVYVLYSIGSLKTYVGFTNDFKRRLIEHNITGTKGLTKKYRPWMLVRKEEYSLKEDAMRREKYLKSGSGREEIKKLIEIFLKQNN